MGWVWDGRARRYRDPDTGRFLPRQDVLAYVEQSIHATEIASDQLAAYVAGGNLSAQDFGALFREEIKREYIRQYLLGVGGRQQMTGADWGRIGGMLADQYRYLRGFVDAIARGELTEEQIMMRARMYINSAREGFERARQLNALALGLIEERWNLGVAEHCADCLAYAAMGWQPLGTFPIPGAGKTQCLTNCQCTLTYRNPESGQQY